MILDFIFKRIPILKQLPDFSSCHVFGTYPGFETITGNHINFNFCAQRFFDKVKYKKIENKNKLFFYNLKIIKALRNQNINIIYSYNL